MPNLHLTPTWRAGLALAVLTFTAGSCAENGDASTSGAAGTFQPTEPGVLTVLAELPARGFWEVDREGEPTGGFEYELALELVDRFDLERVKLIDRPFSEIVRGDHDDYDLALSQISITSDRSETLDFSESYLETPVAAVGLPEVEAPDLEAARDLRWGVVDGTTQVELVTDHVRPRGDDTEVYATRRAALAGVREGKVDVVALDYLQALAEVSAAPDLALVAEVTDPQHYGVALPEGSDNMEAVDAAIRRMHADGTFREMTGDLYDSFDPDVDRDVPTLRVTT